MAQGGTQYLSEGVVRWRVTDQGVICTRCPEFSIPGWPTPYEPLIDHLVEVHGAVRPSWEGQIQIEPSP